jgi:hypothetical protein
MFTAPGEIKWTSLVEKFRAKKKNPFQSLEFADRKWLNVNQETVDQSGGLCFLWSPGNAGSRQKHPKRNRTAFIL